MNPERIDLATYRRAIRNAARANDYVDYYSAGAYARGIHRVIESISALLGDGHAVDVIELAEYALSQVENSLGYVDDSDGRMGGCIHELQELHHRACLQAKPDAMALARRLFEWEMRSEWEFFGGAAVTYADVLGEDALSVYRERIAPLVELTNNAAYEQAVELLSKIRKLMEQLGRETEFDDYLASLRVEFKRKRNFIKLLNAIR